MRAYLQNTAGVRDGLGNAVAVSYVHQVGHGNVVIFLGARASIGFPVFPFQFRFAILKGNLNVNRFPQFPYLLQTVKQRQQHKNQ